MNMTRIALASLALCLLFPLTSQAFYGACLSEKSEWGEPRAKIDGEWVRSPVGFCMEVLLDVGSEGWFHAFTYQPDIKIVGKYTREGDRIVLHPRKRMEKRLQHKLGSWVNDWFEVDSDFDEAKVRRMVGKVYEWQGEEWIWIKSKIRLEGEDDPIQWKADARSRLTHWVAE